MEFKLEWASDNEFKFPVCPFCQKQLDVIKAKKLKRQAGFLSKLTET
jgi:hypothetical protein